MNRSLYRLSFVEVTIYELLHLKILLCLAIRVHWHVFYDTSSITIINDHL